MKKFLTAVIAACMLSCISGPVFAEGVDIKLNGEPLVLDTSAYIKNDRTMVPLRGVFEACGAVVSWDEDTKTVGIVRQAGDNTKFIFLQADADYAFVNSEKKSMDASAEIVSGRTMVPIRFIMEELDAKVLWDADSRTVSISTNN